MEECSSSSIKRASDLDLTVAAFLAAAPAEKHPQVQAHPSPPLMYALTLWTIVKHACASVAGTAAAVSWPFPKDQHRNFNGKETREICSS